MSSFKKTSCAALTFFYVFGAMSPVWADDSEIYLGGVGGSSGNPNVMMLFDTSGSMNDAMSSSDSTTRLASLKAATKQVLTTLPGNIRVGLATYNANYYYGSNNSSTDADGGHVIYPLTLLDAPAGSNTDGSLDVTYSPGSGADDVQQTAATVSTSTFLTSGKTLRIGGVTQTVAFTTSTHTDGSVQCATLTSNPTPFVGLASGWTNSSPRGLYLGSHPVKPTGNYCAGSLGLRYTGVALPAGASIASARLVFTHAGASDATAPSGWSTTGAGRSSDLPLTIRVAMQNTTNATNLKTYSASGTVDTVNGTGRTYDTVTTDFSLEEGEFVKDGDTLDVDVTPLVKNRLGSGTLLAQTGLALAFRLQSQSGNAAAAIIRRIYGSQDGAAKAPRLEITYTGLPVTTGMPNMVGLRFANVDIPQGSSIESAYIELTTAGPATSLPAPAFSISTDKQDSTNINSPSFSTTAGLEPTPTRWGAASTGLFSPDALAANGVSRIDVKDMVQSQVNNSGYCGGGSLTGGNAMSFLIKPTVTSGVRVVYSQESSNGPRLVVNYKVPSASGSTCTSVRRAYTPAASGDDAVQTSSTANTLTGKTIQLKSATFSATKCTTATCAALRFGSIQIPQGAKIVDARLTLVASTTVSTTDTFTIRAIDTNDQAAFTTSGAISSLNLVSTAVTPSPVATWKPSGWTDKTSYESGNLKDVIQPVINRTGWVKGASLGLVLGGSSGNSYFYTYDNKSYQPTLTIIFQSTDGKDAAITARSVLLKKVEDLKTNSGTPLNESYYEVARYMMGMQAFYGRATGAQASGGRLGTIPLQPESADAMVAGSNPNVYNSPVGEASCQSNNIIALTDGLPTNMDSDAVSLGVQCVAPKNVGTVDGQANTYDSFTCMANTAYYLNHTGRQIGSTAEKASIKTYTIGFGPVTNNATGLANVGLTKAASDGGGSFFAPKDADSLAASFLTIFGRIADTNGTMASPGVAVSQLNRSQHLDQLYYGVFKPRTTKRWPGNLKRYKISASDQIVGVDGADAIDPKTKYFSQNAKSWWSSETDGNDATKGGAGSKWNTAINVYTDNGSTMSLLDAASPPAGFGAGAVGQKNAKWTLGYDVDDETAAGENGFRESMGSPIHAQPTLVSYGSTDESFAVFVGTNDGLLHSVNASFDKGTHNWAWMPLELQSRVSDLRTNSGMSAGDTPIYGLDGSWTLVAPDKNTKILVGGMRQGGPNYYAIELPASQTGAPKLKWALRGEGAGAKLSGANTWSQPVPARIRYNGQLKTVVFMGGGMDDAVYEGGGASAISNGTDRGNALYIVDVTDGTILETISKTNHAAMKYSVAGSPRLVDKDGDSLPDHVYFGDLGGQIFRVDLNNAATGAYIKGTALIAKLGVSANNSKANDRRFYETPAVAYVKDPDGKIYAAVAIGSGDRNFPKSNKDTNDRFYVLRDYDAGDFNVPTKDLTYLNTDLDDLSADNSKVSGKKGWYINMPTVGEKVLSSPFIFSRQEKNVSNGTNYLVYEVYFNSFRPDSNSTSSCSPVAGATYAWTIGLFDGAAAKDRNGVGGITNDDRYSADSTVNGISGSDVGLIRDGKLKRITGTDAEDAGKVSDELGKMKRNRWYDR